MNTYSFLFLLLLIVACKKESTSSYEDEGSNSRFYEISEEGYYTETSGYSDDSYDGTYCAEVEYYNPSTGTRSTYELDVEVEDGSLVQIDWPNGGWLDETHFSSEDISNGECSFTSDRGYRYTVTLGEKGGGCYSDGYKLINDVNEEIENTTCPKCGDDKEEYDEYCYSCKRKIDQEEESGEED